MGQLSEVVCGIVGLTFLLATQPALGSSHLYHHRWHGRLSGQAAFAHARLTNRAAFEAGLRAGARKLSLLPSDPSHKTKSKLDAQDSMGGSIKELDARKEEKAQQSVLHPDVAASYYKSHPGNGVGHEELKVSKQSIIAHGELGKSASDSTTSQGHETAVESIIKDLGTRIAATAANAESTPSLRARNFAVDQDQENAMEAAKFSMLVKGRKDGLAHVSLDISPKKKQEKEYKSPQPN